MTVCWSRNRRMPPISKGLVLCTVFLIASFSWAQTQPDKPAESMKLHVLDHIIDKAITDHQIPGAVLLVSHNGEIVYRKAFGYRSLEPHREPMTLDTIFDIA